MRRVAWLALFLAFAIPAAFAGGGVQADQVDDFESGTTANWDEGSPSPNRPTNESDGGPLGSGDNFLQAISSGGAGPGSRQVIYNRVQWTGDFASAGVRQIEFDARNLGNTDLFVRVGFQSQTNTRWVSTDPVMLTANGDWTSVAFELNSGAMTRVSGIDDFTPAISNVNEFRVLSAQAQPSWLGDVVVSTLGLDNIFASTVPVELIDFSVE